MPWLISKFAEKNFAAKLEYSSATRDLSKTGGIYRAVDRPDP